MAALLEGDPKVPFLIATINKLPFNSYLGVRKGATPLLGLFHFTLDTLKCWVLRRYQVPFFEFLVWLDPGLNSSPSDHWRTLYPIGQWAERHNKNSSSDELFSQSTSQSSFVYLALFSHIHVRTIRIFLHTFLSPSLL